MRLLASLTVMLVAGSALAVPATDFREIWSLDLPESVQGGLAAGGGRVYIALADGSVRALKVEDGTEKWRRNYGGDLESGLALVKETLLLVDASNRLRAFSSVSGEPRWDTRLQARGVSLGAGETTVCVGEAGACSAYSLEKGTSLWRHPTRGEVQTDPWVGDSVAIFGSADHRVYIADRNSGERQKAILLSGEVMGGPAAEPSAARRPAIAVGTHEGRLQLLLRTGAKVWNIPVHGVVRAAPLLQPDTVVAGTDKGTLYCVDRDSGRVIWRLAVGGPVADRIVRLGEAIVVGAGGALVFVRASNGEFIKNLPVGGVIMSLVAEAGRVVVATSNRRLVAAGLKIEKVKEEARPAEQVVSLVVEPRRFDLRKPGTLEVSFSLLREGSLVVDVAEVSGRRMRLLDNRDKAWPGDYRFEWDGRDANGKPVAPGIYRVRIVAGTEEYSVGFEVKGRR